MYYFVFIVYRFTLDSHQQRIFENIAAHCDKKLDYIPLTFMLGFFVTIIVDRWRQIFNNMGWIENAALTIATLFRGDSKELRLMRRTVIRYLVLAQVLTFRDISLKVRRRFPNLESIVTAGFLQEHEKQMMENLPPSRKSYWIPINWALTLCFRAHKDGHINAPPSLNTCLNEIKAFRTNLALLCNFDWVPIPIAYPQVVFLAVRVYFVICLISRQYIISDGAVNKSVIDLYVPFMTILQFVFLVGWMKVAEALLNPLGEDDDDFECNYLIDQNIANGLAIVDETFEQCPTTLPDRFMDPNYQPVYSEDSKKHGHDGALIGSAEGIKLADAETNVKMVSLDVGAAPGATTGATASGPRSRTTARLRRQFTNVLNLSRPRAYSVQPLHLDAVKPTYPQNPERPYTAFDLSNGFAPSKHIPDPANGLGKVEEESDKSRSHSPLSTVESVDENDVPELFNKELKGGRKSL
ncbi:hypothetical protein Q1695_006596 [Nippostrongylus brasiliensis]|nr:hypothetical protein Q1695_006596 [Nippostrongylus brasiliensis]